MDFIGTLKVFLTAQKFVSKVSRKSCDSTAREFFSLGKFCDEKVFFLVFAQEFFATKFSQNIF